MPKASPNLNHQLNRKLRRLYGMWRRKVFWSGMAKTVIIALFMLAAALTTDAILNLTFRQRLILALILYTILIIDAFKTWMRRIIQPYSPRKAAWLLEAVNPALKEKLITAVELAETQPESLSPDLITYTLEQAKTNLEKMKPEQIFPIGRGNLWTVSAAIVICSLSMVLPGFHMPARINRVLLPSPRDPRLGATSFLQLVKPWQGEYKEGDMITATAKASLSNQTQAIEIVVQTDTITRHTMEKIKHEDENIYQAAFPAPGQKFRIWAEAGMVKSRAYDFNAVARPFVQQFQIDYRYPEYTGRSPRRIMNATPAISAVRDTYITLAALFSKPVREAALELDEGVVDGLVAEDGYLAIFKFKMAESQAANLTMICRDGLPPIESPTIQIHSQMDAPPQVTIESPAHDLNTGINGKIDFEWASTDDFGVTRQLIKVETSDEELLKSTELHGDAGRYTVDIGALSLKPGQVINVSIKAFDAKKQYGRSQPRQIIITPVEKITGTTRFIANLSTLNSFLSAAQEDAARLRFFIRISKKTDHPWQTGAVHYQKIIADEKARLRTNLEQARLQTLNLQGSSTFMTARISAVAMEHCLNKQLLANLPAILDSGNNNSTEYASAALDKLTNITDYSLRLTQALSEKAIQHQAAEELPQLLQALHHNKKEELNNENHIHIAQAVAGSARSLWEAHGFTPPDDLNHLPHEINAGNVNSIVADMEQALAAVKQKVKTQLTDDSSIENALNSLIKSHITPASRLQELHENARANWGRLPYWEFIDNTAEAFLRMSTATHPRRRNYRRQRLMGAALRYARSNGKADYAALVMQEMELLVNRQSRQNIYGDILELDAQLLQTQLNLHNNNFKNAVDLRDALEHLLINTEILCSETLALRRLNAIPLPSKFDDTLLKLRNKIGKTLATDSLDRKATTEDDQEAIDGYLQEAKLLLRQAARYLAEQMAKSEINDRIALKKIKSISPSRAAQLRLVKDRMNQLVDNISMGRAAPAQAASNLQRQTIEIAAIADDLRQQAMEALYSPTAEIATAYAGMAAALALEALNMEEFEPALNILLNLSGSPSHWINNYSRHQNTQMEEAENQVLYLMTNGVPALNEMEFFLELLEQHTSGQLNWGETQDFLQRIEAQTTNVPAHDMPQTLSFLSAAKNIARQLELLRTTESARQKWLHSKKPNANTMSILMTCRTHSPPESAATKPYWLKQPHLELSMLLSCLKIIRELEVTTIQAQLAADRFADIAVGDETAAALIQAWKLKSDEYQRQLQELTRKMEEMLKPYNCSPPIMAALKAMTHFHDHATIGDFTKAQNNLKALRENIYSAGQTPKETRRDIVLLLENAATTARQNNREYVANEMADARKAINRGQWTQARQRVFYAILDRFEAARAIAAIDELQNTVNHRIPYLMQALNAVQSNRFHDAKDILMMLNLNNSRDTITAISQAQNAVNAVVKGAMRDAFYYSPENPANLFLEKTSLMIARGDFVTAAEYAAAAGAPGFKALNALARLEEYGQAAYQNLRRLFEAEYYNIQKQRDDALQKLAGIPDYSYKAISGIEQSIGSNGITEEDNIISHIQQYVARDHLEKAYEAISIIAAEAWPAYQAIELMDDTKTRQVFPVLTAFTETGLLPDNAKASVESARLAEKHFTAARKSNAAANIDVAYNHLNDAVSAGRKAAQNIFRPPQSQNIQMEAAQFPEPFNIEVSLLRPWADIDNVLQRDNFNMSVAPYASYYREANRQYLQKLAEEIRP